MVGNGAMADVGNFACLFGSSIVTSPGEAGERFSVNSLFAEL